MVIVALLAVAALYVALMLALPRSALTRTRRRTATTVLALGGLTALGVTTALVLAADPAFSLVSFVQSPVLIAAGATVAALLALFGALRSVEQQRAAAAVREAAESERESRRYVLDSEIAETSAGLRWTAQFTAACRGVLDASGAVEIATTLAIVDVLTDQAPNPELGGWAAGVGIQLRAPADRVAEDEAAIDGSEEVSAAQP